jgi:dTDP-4-amino-4,6-dideoxygalactose transaminase
MSGVQIPMLDLKAQFAAIEGEIRIALDRVLARQHFALGPEGEALEHELSSYCERHFAVGVASGTDALMLGLRACGVTPGSEVIVPTFTFIATAGAVSALGARPVFADTDPATFNLDPKSAESLITPRTAAIIAVHLYGGSADLTTLAAVAARHRIPLIEDNAQSLGATYQEKKVGSFGSVSATSFYPSKNLGAFGDGGMILTDSEEIAEHLRMLRNHGQKERYLSVEMGWNSRLDEVQAAVLRVKLRHLDSWIAARRRHAQHYTARLGGIAGIQTPHVAPLTDHTWYLYTLRIENDKKSESLSAASRRDLVARHLADNGIASSVFYPVPLHLQPIYQGLGGRLGDLPVAERACQEVLSLPFYPEMTSAQIDRVCDAIVQALSI